MSVIPTINGKKFKQYSKLQAQKMSQKWDVIIIGSGMAGMSAASALSKFGKKVLLLEQHYIPGGFTHMYGRKGYAWDAGTHAIGEMKTQTPVKKMLDWLSAKKIDWISLGKEYDRFYFGNGKVMNFPDTPKEMIGLLKREFPNEVDVIDRYITLCKNAVTSSRLLFGKNMLPSSFQSPVSKISKLFTDKYFLKTTKEVLNKLGMSNELQRVVTAQWGYYGNPPFESSFGLHALVVWHFIHGASYPKGGSKVFAEGILQEVANHHGEILCRARVKRVLVDNDRATGVELEDGYKFFAKYVISAAAIKTTVKNLLPEKFALSDWGRSILEVKNSPSYISLNMGFEEDISKLGADLKNHWIYATDDLDAKLWKIENKDEVPPIIYISFPSVKDPGHMLKDKLKHTAECITFVPWETFAKWKDSDYQDRDQEYEDLKEEMSKRLIACLQKHFPAMMAKLSYYELSTPLTTKHFAESRNGAIYGLDCTPERFACQELGPNTPIKNFYLTGVDTLAPGIAGAMSSGLVTAAKIDLRALPHLL